MLILLLKYLFLNAASSGLFALRVVFACSGHTWVSCRMFMELFCNSLASNDLVENMPKPHKYLQLFLLALLSPPIIPPVWLISWDLTPDLNGVAWQASDVVCPKAGILGFSSSLRPGRWELLAQSCPVFHPLPNPPWDQLPGVYQGGEDSPLGTACPTHIVKT